MGFSRIKIATLTTLFALSLALFFLIKFSSTIHPLEPFYENPWWFLGSFLVLPAFCQELARVDVYGLFDTLALMIIFAQVIAISFFVHVILSLWKSKDSLVSVLVEKYMLGLFLNFGNFFFTAFVMGCSA